MLSTPRTLKAAARNSLAQADYDPRRIILIHTGVVLLLSALLMVVDYLLEQRIGAAVGLSGLGTRAMLTTVQSVLQLAQVVIIPFWQMGYLFAALQIARGENAAPESLLQGFRRFGSALRLMILMGLVLVGLVIAGCYIASFLFMITPWGKEMMAQVTALVESGNGLTENGALENIIYAALLDYTVPMVLICGGIVILIVVPQLYRMRFAQYVVMDGERSAMMALRTSRRITKGNCKDLLKLDLSFWWFYLLDILLTALCYGDMLLEKVGITLPFPAATSYFLFFSIYAVGQLVLYYTCRNRVEVTYAHAYCELNPQAE